MPKPLKKQTRGGPGTRKTAEPAPEDPRAHRSRAMLRDALLGLMRERGFDSISVQDITERAQLNRSTFYLHYRDKDELLTHVMRDMILELSRRSHQMGDSPDRLHRTLVEWFQHAAEHPELYHLMLGRSGMRAFSMQLRKLLEQLMNLDMGRPGVSARFHGVPVPVMNRFMASAYMGVLEWWLDRRALHPPEEMARWLGTLTAMMNNRR
ncbi:regulatory protein, TetR [Cystobacter fuscus DSM 2262]|uniref:Regulatory protein, TetR n=1 Tax=Cystobacter fuscus (strain ATCC 25194 / DSM 2262 / NBRC 100088 / M29) TaxID=1242864 RepID=S9P8M8_CYSF2|nr:TetR/AcrR family transcriptional regulator [Cystobacter fuscus]EPX60800.1 regulatory protein, TetR [Cystobacter fuscus DSM 2262]